MITEKAQKVLNELKERDRKNLKRWRPYTGPSDWNFAVLNAPKGLVEEEREERPEVSNG